MVAAAVVVVADSIKVSEAEEVVAEDLTAVTALLTATTVHTM